MIQTAQETVEVPQLQFIDEVVNVLDVEQQQLPKAPPVQCIDKAVDVLVVRFVQVTRSHAMERTAETTQLQVAEVSEVSVIDRPCAVLPVKFQELFRQVAEPVMQQTVERTMKVLQLLPPVQNATDCVAR